MNDNLDEILKKIANDMSAASTQNSSSTENRSMPINDLPGDPDCPHCQGLGYLRRDLPVGHPDFGKVTNCSCRQQQIHLQMRERLYALSHLEELRHLTFDVFEPRGRIGLSPRQASSLERAFNLTRQYAGSHKGWLLLQGGFGCGKTHLAAAVANEAVDHGVPTLFITVPDLLDSLRFTYQNPDATFEEQFDQIRQAPLLVLDDFGTQNATSWAQEKLFQILNYRYINQLPLVVTTNLALEEIEGRIRSRLQDPDLVSRVYISAPDYRRPTDDMGYLELSSLELLADRTFGNFSLRKRDGITAKDLKSLEKAFQIAQAYAEQPEGWLVFLGPYGSGKTHLAAAIANHRHSMGYPVRLLVVPDLMDHLRATFSPKSSTTYDRRFEDVRTTPLLVLDDLGTQSMTPWVQEKLYQLFNYRYNAGLPTVITSASSLEELDPRIASRMMDVRLCKIYAITVPPFRGKPRS